MKALLMGPPGAGKGTQAAHICETWSIPHVSTGNILRDAIASGSELGTQVKAVVESGGYVSDELMIPIVGDALASLDGFLLDGFPRTWAQAEALDEILGRPLDAVIFLDVPDDAIVERMAGRRTCPVCQRAYHVTSNPPQTPGRCDDDGTELVVRADDEPATVRKRLAVYHEQTDSLIGRYAAQGNLIRVDGLQSVEQVADDIARALKERGQ